MSSSSQAAHKRQQQDEGGPQQQQNDMETPIGILKASLAPTQSDSIGTVGRKVER